MHRTAPHRHSRLRIFPFLATLSALLAGILTTGCGSGSVSPGTGNNATGNTAVTVMLSSTANDQLSLFKISFSSLTLTNKAGKSVNLLPQQSAEFIHLNGAAEPLVTVNMPQDTYTAAELTLNGYTGFSCVSQPPGEVQVSFFSTNIGSPVVTLNSPIAVAGESMTLLLDLQVSQSAMFSDCNLSNNPIFSITPTFNLIPFSISPQPTNARNGKASGVNGLVSSVASSKGAFVLTTADGASVSFATNQSTVYQGIPSASALSVGMPVDMDAAVQSDGSLLALRVSVVDTDTTTLSLTSGPLLLVSNNEPVILMFQRVQQGALFSGLVGGDDYFSFGNAVFQTSGQFSNLQSLPFSPIFTSANMVAGQNIVLTTHATDFAGGPLYVPASTVTLMPQTINGTVTAVSTSGIFSTYTVTLASYDLIPSFAVEPGQTTLLTDPNTVVVYVDSSTQKLNTTPLEPGSVLRFNGLLFNDNGTLRMDCGQVDDGVTG